MTQLQLENKLNELEQHLRGSYKFSKLEYGRTLRKYLLIRSRIN